MKKLISALAIAVLALFSPMTTSANAAELTQPEAERIARDLGCKASVSLVRNDSYNGYFAYDYTGNTAVVVFGNESLDQDIARAILLHEIGHCIQFQNGEKFDLPWKEWDADEFAMRNSHVAGIDPATNRNALAWLYRNRPAHEGMDEPHGSPAGRILFNDHQLRRLFPGRDFQGA